MEICDCTPVPVSTMVAGEPAALLTMQRLPASAGGRPGTDIERKTVARGKSHGLREVLRFDVMSGNIDDCVVK